MRQPVSVPEAVIADLARRVSELEQQIGSTSSPEQLTPSYLTVTPTGQVGANFSGIIDAQGVTLPAASNPGAMTSANRVQWNDSAGDQVAYDFVSYDGTNTERYVQATQPGGALSGGATLQLESTPSTAQIEAWADGLQALIWNNQGRSSFLQTPTEAQWAFNIGTLTLPFSAAARSSTVTVSHGLGRVPQFVGLTSTALLGTAVFSLVAFTFTTTQFSAIGQASASATANLPCQWIAIG